MDIRHWRVSKHEFQHLALSGLRNRNEHIGSLQQEMNKEQAMRALVLTIRSCVTYFKIQRKNFTQKSYIWSPRNCRVTRGFDPARAGGCPAHPNHKSS